MLAIKLKTGKIITNRRAYIHSDFITFNIAKYEDIESCGFITIQNNEYYETYRPGTSGAPAF